MDREMIAVLLSFVLYALYVLVPIIPATLIYRWFPNTGVAVNGTLSNFKINSAGAFAAYIVVVLLGLLVIRPIQEKMIGILQTQVAPTWTINGAIELQDEKGNPVNYPSLLKQIDVSVKPEIFTSDNGNINLKLPGAENGGIPQLMIHLNVLGFGSETLNLNRLDQYQVKVDSANKVISFQNPIVVRTINEQGKRYGASQHYLNPLVARAGGSL